VSITSNPTAVAIAVEAVHKRYGAVAALNGVTLQVRRGEFFGLLGPNGAGKSTLISIIAGLTRFDSGRVTVLGRDVVREYRHTRRAIGVVPQEVVFDPFFSVREVLEIQSGYFGIARRANAAWIDELLDTLMLTDKAGANMRALSGGMKRRVMIAQALVHRPEVLVLDEPTAGVDVELRKSLWAFVRKLHAQGMTIVLTTHYLEEAETLCERIGIIDRGELIALDTKASLLARGAGRSARLTLTLAPPIPALPPAIAALVREQRENQIEFELKRDGASIVTVLDGMRQAGATIRDIAIEEPKLEDVFVELTRRGRL